VVVVVPVVALAVRPHPTLRITLISRIRVIRTMASTRVLMLNSRRRLVRRVSNSSGRRVIMLLRDRVSRVVSQLLGRSLVVRRVVS
jgi:hypothetical protein